MSTRGPKSVDSQEDLCRRRAEESIQIRKNKRMQNLQKRRAMARGKANANTNSNANSNANANNTNANNVVATNYDESVGTVAKVSDLPRIAATIKKMTPAQRFEATRGIRRLLSAQENPPAEEVIEAGLVPILVAELGLVTEEKTQFEAAWALTNIASTEHTRAIVNAGAIKPLAALMMSKSPDIREQCLWCLGNVCGDGHDLRDIVLAAPKALTNLLTNIKHAASESLLGNAVWTLSNFCRGKPQPALDVIKPALPYLARLIKHKKQSIVGDACWALSYISDGADERIQACVDLGIVPTLMRLLASDNCKIVTPALRTLGNIVSGNDTHTQAVLDANCFGVVMPLLHHDKRTVRKETCWLLSNIAAGTPSQVSELVAREDVLTRVMELLESDDFDVRKEAAWVVSNICTGGTSGDIRQIIQYGALKTLVEVMDVQSTKITSVTLEAVEAILKKCGSTNIINEIENLGGIDKLEVLQDHSDESIYEKSKALLETYFNEEDEEEDDDNNSPGFGFGENQDPSMNSSSPSKGFSSDPFGVDMKASTSSDPFGASNGFNTQQADTVDWGF